jgi:hypothetical protein
MPFRERNSFVLRQLLQPGWVNSRNRALVFSIVIRVASIDRPMAQVSTVGAAVNLSFFA